MTRQLADRLEIRVAPADQRVESLWLVFAWEEAERRNQRVAACFQAERECGSAFPYLLEAQRGGDRRGAVWGQVAPGRLAHVWAPGLVEGEPDSTADQLQLAVDERLAAAGLQCGQATLPRLAHAPANCLLRSGYALAAELLYLASTAAEFPAEPPATDLSFEPYADDQQPRLIQLLDATYIGTQDAPLLDNVRPTQEVLHGYRQTGKYAPERWLFVRDQQRDVGCLLVADHPEAKQCELMYMGLIPSARGRGWGSILPRQAQWLAAQAGAESMIVGVDAANHPALAVYSRCGFHQVDERLVFIKRFSLNH